MMSWHDNAFHITALCKWNPLMNGVFPYQKASAVELYMFSVLLAWTSCRTNSWYSVTPWRSCDVTVMWFSQWPRYTHQVRTRTSHANPFGSHFVSCEWFNRFQLIYNSLISESLCNTSEIRRIISGNKIKHGIFWAERFHMCGKNII